MSYDILDKTKESIEFGSTGKVKEIENEIKSIQDSNPYKINNKLAKKGFIATYDGLYRKYISSINAEYYLKISRENGEKFKLNYCWCIKDDDKFNVISEIYSTKQSIFEDKPQRNKLLGKYTLDYNIPRGETGSNILG